MTSDENKEYPGVGSGFTLTVADDRVRSTTFLGRSAGYFPEQRLVIEPNFSRERL